MAITPLELRNRARERISSRSNANYSEYYKKQVEQQVLKDEQSNSNKNGFIRAMATAGDVLGNVFLGLAKGTEGLFDFTIGSIATPIGLFNSNFAEGVKSVIKYNAVDDLVGNRMQDALKDSYLKESGIMEGVSQGIGQMLPAVALSFIPYVGPGVALAYTASSAAGNASEQAYQEGAGLIQGQVYGAAVGGVEAATEKIFGGATSKVFGAGKLDNIFGKVAKTGVARVVKNAAEEGFEEVVAEVANPALKSIYKGKDAFKEYGDAEYWKDVAKAGVIGAGTSVAYGGTVGKITRTSGIDADISDSLQEINTLDNKRRNLYADGNLTAERKKYYYETKLANLENIEKGLKKSTIKERARRIEKNGLEKYFEQNGSLKASVRANLEKGMQSTAESDSRYISPDLEDNIEKVNSDIESISQTLKTKYGAEAEDIKVYDKELTQKGEGEYKKLKTVQKAFNKKSGVNVGLVVLDENSNFDGTLVDDTIYITKDKLENGDWSKVIVHENFHFAKGPFAKGTKEYHTLFDYLTSLDVEVVDASGKLVRVSLDKLATDKVLRKGYLTAEELENIKNKTKNNQELTKQERAIAEEYTDELGAHMSEEVLGNEEFINKIISDSKNKNLIEKIINKIVDLKYAFQRAKMSKADESLKTLETAEKLYLDAIEKAGYAYIGRKLVVVKKDEEELNDVRYSYIGRKAKSVDLTILDKAMQRIDAGEDAETVRKETGWFKGYDGQWRYEISDKNALLLDNDKFETHITDDGSYYTAKLSDVLDHKQLFEAYPQLKELTLIIQETEFGTDGISFANDNQIVINKGLFQRNTKEYNDVLSEKQKRIKEIEKTPEYKEYSMFFESDYDEIGITPEQWLEREEAAEKKFFNSEHGKEYYKLVWGKTSDDIVKKELGWSDMAISVLLHELQHHIQFIEGFAAGSSDTFWYKKMLNRYKSEYESSRTEFLKLLQRAKGDFREALYLLETAVGRFDLSETMIARACDNASKFTEDENELQILWNFTEAGKTLNMFYKKGDLLASHMYEKTAGEIEARDVARRREMSDQERKDIRPNINERGVVFVEDVDKSIALSYNKKEKYAKRDFNSVTEEEFKHHYWAVANNLLSKEELGVLNSAIGNISRGEVYNKNSDGFFMIPVGEKGILNKIIFTDGKKGSYSINSIIEIACNNETDLTDIRGVIYAGEKHGIHTENSELFKIYYGKDYRYNDFITELQNSSQDSNGEQDGARSSRKVKFSLKDSDGNALSPEQQEFFKDSKVRDEQGRLIVLYHGSKTDVNEFSKEFISGWNMFGKGYYFTSSKRRAQGYAKGSLKEVYINLVNPFFANKREYLDKILTEINNSREDIQEYSEVHEIGGSEFFKICYYLDDIGADISKILQKLGYDGIYYEGYEDVEIVAYESNQIKLTTNKNPTENNDIRFSRKEKVESRNLTQGEMRKMLANYTKKKVYSKAESEIVANEIIDKILVFDDKYGSIKGKTKAEAISMLWNALNTKDAGHRMGPALDIADYFIENAIVTDMFEEAEYDESLTFISVAKEFLHKLDLKGIREEIKHKFENNSVYLMWSGGTIGPDELPGLLAERGIVLSSELGSEAFFELHERYLKARDTVNNKAKKALQHVLSTEEIKELRQKIAREILLAYNEKGAESKLSKILNEHNKELKSLREKARENRRYSNQVGRVMFQVDKMKKIKNGTFLNATTYKQDVLKKSVEELAKVTNRGVISSKTRDIISRLKSWYTKENPMLGYYSDTEPGSYDFNIAESLEYIASGTSRELTYKELLALEDVVAYFNNFAEKFNNIWRNGKYVEAKTIAEDYVSIQQENEKYKSFIFNTKLPLVTKWYSAYADPMSIARKLDRYNPNGFFTEMMENLRYGAIDSANIEYKLRSTVEEFYSKNKKYLKTLKTEKCVNYEGYLLTKAQAISLYMTLSRQQAILGLAASGFAYIDVETKKPVRIKGFAEDAVLDNLPQLETLARAAKADLLRQFNSTDAEYIQILEKVFNEDCKNYKSETDKKRNGYTNVSDGYYFPVRRNALAKNIETISLFEEINSVSNASFNKDTVKGAKTELYIEDVDVVFDRHVKGIAQYAGLATVIDEFNILLNANVGDNVNKPVSVATESAQLWGGAINYFRDMLKDIQGIGAKNSGVVNWLRGNYAKAVLGLNPKVLFTQLSSVFASLNILSVENLVKGVNISAKFADGLDEYSVVAKLRNSDNTVVKAQGVIDEIGAVGNALTKPIAMVDRGVVKLLWGPCQLQVQKEQGLALGTKENKIEAGKLLDKVILETQQNSLASEKTAAARSNSEFLRASVMFRADIIKLTGRFFDAIGENLVLSKKLKLATTLSEQVEIKKQLNKAKKKLVSSICSLTFSSLYIALIAKAFRWLYNKDEDENVWKNIVVDFFGNILGGFPIISDVYSKIFEGYDVDSFEYSTINNVISSFENLAKTDWTDSNSITSSFKKAMDSMAQFLGLPTKNIYKNIYGILDKFNPEAAYKLDNLFYNKNYSSDLKKAIENEDMDMIATITGIMLNENIGDVGSESVRIEMNKLIADGQSVLPRSVGDSITYDGEVVQLTARQKARFKTIYSQANKEIADLIRTKHYINASNEIKAKAIKFIYDMYYNLALEDLLGEELVTKNLLFSKAIDIDKLAIIVTSSRNLKADTDSKGNAISGSKKSKVYAYVQSLKMTAAEKYMIMGYLGYTNTKGDKQVKSYIQSLKMTKKQKELLYEYSGYAI